MPARKLVVSTYLQYILLAVGFFLLLVFAVPVVAATLRFLRGALIFERWSKAPLVPATQEGPPPETTSALERAEPEKGVRG